MIRAIFRHAVGPLVVAGLLWPAAGCKGRDDLDGERRRLPGLAERGQEMALPTDGKRTAFDLLSNRASASVHAGGALVIDAGSVDIHKYIEGGYRAPWITGVTVDGRPASLIDGLAGELYLPIDDDPGGVQRDRDGDVPIYLEVRPAKADQLVSVFLNENKLGDVAMPTTDWKQYKVVAPASAVRSGENKLRFYFRHTDELAGSRTAAAFASIRVGTSAAGTLPLTTIDAERGGKRLRAMSMSGPGRLSFYLTVPHGSPQLVMAVGGAPDAALSVAVTSGDAADHTATVWSGKAGADWQLVRADLGEYAGDVVRLDLMGSGPVDWGHPQVVVPVADRPEPSARKPVDHVIVWVVAALRADRLGGEVPTPAFDRFAGGGLRFGRAVSASPSPGPAHVSLLTGRHADSGTVPPGARTLGQRFRDAGYHTALISGNGFVNDEAGFARGFDLYRNPMRLRRPFQARFLWQRARRILADHADDRTFIYLATVEPHLPYTPSDDSLAAEWTGGAMSFTPAETATVAAAVSSGKRRLSEEERRYLRALYDAEVRDADQAFGEMLAELDKLGLRDRTAVILVADHGEELFERGEVGHGGHLHEEVLRIPLVVSPPGLDRGQAIDAPVESIDVYNTALALAGIAPSPEAQGASVLELRAGAPEPARPLISDIPGRARALRVGPHKLIVGKRGPTELYHLGLDPGEKTNLMGSRPLIERYLRNAFGIATAFRQAWNPMRWGEATNMSPAFAADHGL